MNVFVINLEHSVERRNNIKKLFCEINLEYSFFNAINGNLLSEKDLQEHVIETNFLSKGEIGCALTHLNIYKKMIDDDIDYALILEDDIQFSKQLNKTILDKIGGYIANIPKEEPSVILLSNSSYSGKKIATIDDITIRRPLNAFSAYAYFINKQAAQNILEIQTPLRFEIDAWKLYIYLHKLNLFCVSPSLVTPNDEYDSIIKSMEGRVFSRERGKHKNSNFYMLFKELPLNLKIKTYLMKINKALFGFKKKNKNRKK